ncbi:MAG TPA: TetR/AcrR family transcriptional regulator [Bacillota bacterium]
MVRITKVPDIRRNEIIETAEELFLAKGFEETTVSDIVRQIGVAQGLFYYYFKSKDEVLDVIIGRYAEEMLKIIQALATDSSLDAATKIRRIFSSMLELSKDKGPLVNWFHQKQYEEMHQRLATKMVMKLIPIFAGIIREGMKNGLFKLEEPDETAEILLIGLEYYLNRMVRAYWGTPEFDLRIKNAINVCERILGVSKGSLQLMKTQVSK